MFKILIIANPVSGGYNENKLKTVTDILKQKCDKVDIILTEYKGHAEIISKNAEYELIIAAGGDGLINETARGICGSSKLFAALPFGTVNVFCREYGIGLNPVKAAKRLNLSEAIGIPIGYIDEHPFLLMAGFGFDAATVEKVEKKEKRTFKTLSHILNGISALIKEKYQPFTICYDGKRKTAYHAVFAVTSSYAGSFKLGNIETGKINAFFIDNNGRYGLFKAFISLFMGFGFKGKRLYSDYIKIEGASSCQLDGDYTRLSNTSSYIKIKRNAINLIICGKK